MILKRTKGRTARGIDSPSVSSQQHVMWVFCFFSYHIKDQMQTERRKKKTQTNRQRGKEERKRKRRCGAAF